MKRKKHLDCCFALMSQPSSKQTKHCCLCLDCAKMIHSKLFYASSRDYLIKSIVIISPRASRMWFMIASRRKTITISINSRKKETSCNFRLRNLCKNLQPSNDHLRYRSCEKHIICAFYRYLLSFLALVNMCVCINNKIILLFYDISQHHNKKLIKSRQKRN